MMVQNATNSVLSPTLVANYNMEALWFLSLRMCDWGWTGVVLLGGCIWSNYCCGYRLESDAGMAAVFRLGQSEWLLYGSCGIIATLPYPT